jgi:hypothetical protein
MKQQTRSELFSLYNKTTAKVNIYFVIRCQMSNCHRQHYSELDSCICSIEIVHFHSQFNVRHPIEYNNENKFSRRHASDRYSRFSSVNDRIDFKSVLINIERLFCLVMFDLLVMIDRKTKEIRYLMITMISNIQSNIIEGLHIEIISIENKHIKFVLNSIEMRLISCTYDRYIDQQDKVVYMCETNILEYKPCE